MLSALARWCGHHRKLVVLSWVLLAVGLLAGARLVEGSTADDVAVPGSDSQAANVLLAEADMFGRQSSQLVLTAPRGRYVDASQLQTAIRDTAAAVSAVPGVGTVPERVEPSPDRTAVRFSVPLDPGTTADKAL
ncbi:hypothetical protein, partial [Actinophytocola sp.]|uniref:hypothetical protein n=1 Tax=Actinophytocola sp. TaxID=1872138 RepID=UPI002D9D3EB1|nr:hypothetical protein [Actinophytocola sp.]